MLSLIEVIKYLLKMILMIKFKMRMIASCQGIDKMNRILSGLIELLNSNSL